MDFKEKCKNARAFIVLLAAFITLLLNIKYERELVKSLIMVIVVIIIFYIISTVAIKLVDKIRNMDTGEPYNPEENEEYDENEGQEQDEEA
ncbi:MAG: hypothetical protein ACI4D8_06995 [Wujia sp.]